MLDKKHIWSEKIDAILNAGIFLKDYRNWALSKYQALNAITNFEKENIAILGGDVLIKEGYNYIHESSSWYCNKEENESKDEYVVRSTSAAKSYIERFPVLENIFFSIVAQE